MNEREWAYWHRDAAPKTNYYQESLKELETIHNEFQYRRPRLLLHACCAPCAAFPLEFLEQTFDVTIFYNNSNIYPAEEYQRRLGELKRYLQEVWPGIPLIVPPYDNAAYTKKLEPQKDLPEGCGRCFYCYALRMDEAYRFAAMENFDFFTTVMTISRQKDSQKMNEIGRSLAKKYPSVRYFYSDFKKNRGIDRGQELSRQHSLYRQDYCGCLYSYQGRHPQ